jgi:protein TonB
MKEKKSAKADLESRRGLFIEIGLVVVLALVYMAFEMKSYETSSATQFERTDVIVEEEMVEITQQEKIELPPPPPQQTILFQEVADDIKIENDIDIDAEANASTEIEAVTWNRPAAVEEDIAEEEVFVIVENNPEYPGGDEARLNFLRNNIKYPQMARETGIQGTVYVGFVVEKDGSVTQVKVLRGIGGGCDEEAIRVTKMMPKWKAGKQRGKEVRVSYSMPVKFTLQD